MVWARQKEEYSLLQADSDLQVVLEGGLLVLGGLGRVSW